MDRVVEQSYQVFSWLQSSYPAIEAFLTFKTPYVREVAIGKLNTS